MRIDYALRQHQQWYKGDGVYGDGPVFHWDYYNSFVIHPMLIDVLRQVRTHNRAWDGMMADAMARARRYAAIQERLIAPDGSYPAVGRSIAYRCGAFQTLAQMALLGELPGPLAPGGVRGALTAVMRRTLDAPGTFDAEGWLRWACADTSRTWARAIFRPAACIYAPRFCCRWASRHRMPSGRRWLRRGPRAASGMARTARRTTRWADLPLHGHLGRFAAERVVERVRGFDRGAFLRHRNRQHLDAVVVRQHKRLRAGRQIQGVREQVRICVRLIQALGGVVVRAIPRHIGPLDVARLQAHVVVRIARRPVAAALRPLLGRIGIPYRVVRRNGPVLSLNGRSSRCAYPTGR